MIIALIVAAGESTRFNHIVAKPYSFYQKKPILAHAIELFQNNHSIDKILVVINPKHKKEYHALTDFIEGDLPDYVLGGKERQDSVKNGLDSLKDIPPQWVIIHDAARPFTSPSLLKNMLDKLKKNKDCKGLIPVWPVTDSLKKLDKAGNVISRIERDNIFYAQTPQIFNFAALLQAHESSSCYRSDDAALIEDYGLTVVTVTGERNNIKLTYQEDMPMPVSDHIVTGFGIDVHRAKSGNQIILCGVTIPAPFSLDGHSDADVGLHALCDAILGTLAEGDIGAFFPPSDPQWKDACSKIFLDHCLLRLKKRQATLVHIDLTFLCETPAISPQRHLMQQKLSEWTKLDKARISIKATTNEGLDAIGRKEAIMAYAQVTVKIIP